MPASKLERNLQILMDRKKGMTYRAFSDKYGIAGQRVWRIVRAMELREKHRPAKASGDLMSAQEDGL